MSWTLYIVTASGREIPHWTDRTRERCRKERRALGTLPRGVRTVIRRG